MSPDLVYLTLNRLSSGLNLTEIDYQHWTGSFVIINNILLLN